MRGSGAVRNIFVLGLAFWSWLVGLNKPPCNWHANSRNQLVKSKDKGKEKHKIKRNTQTLKHPWRKLRVIIIWASFSVFTFDNCIIKFSQNGTATKRAAAMLLTIIADAMPGKRKYRRKENEKFEIICIRAEHASKWFGALKISEDANLQTTAPCLHGDQKSANSPDHCIVEISRILGPCTLVPLLYSAAKRLMVLCVLGRKTMISVIKDNPYWLIINMAMVYMIVSSEITRYWLLWWPGDKMYGTLLISFGKGGNLNAKNGMGKRAWHGLQNVNMQNAK